MESPSSITPVAFVHLQIEMKKNAKIKRAFKKMIPAVII
jgi:hypothetical protein